MDSLLDIEDGIGPDTSQDGHVDPLGTLIDIAGAVIVGIGLVGLIVAGAIASAEPPSTPLD